MAIKTQKEFIINECDELSQVKIQKSKYNKSTKRHRKTHTLEKEEIKNNTAVIRFRSISIVIISILFYSIAFLIKNIDANNPDLNISFLDFICELIENVSGVVLGLGLGAMLLDFFSYVKYSQERIKEVMIDKSFLKTIKDDEKKRMISILESSLYFKDGIIPEDSLYANVRDKITPLLEKEYIENHYVHIECTLTDGCIKKEFTNELSIISPDNNAEYSLPFSIHFKNNTKVNGKNPFEVISLNVNGKDIDIPSEDSNGIVVDDTKKFLMDTPFPLLKGKNIIKYKTVSYVSDKDNTYSHTVTYPCKHYTIEMYIDSDDYEVNGYGFCIEKKETMNVNTYPRGCRIEFNDWIIPGDGCIFVINKK